MSNTRQAKPRSAALRIAVVVCASALALSAPACRPNGAPGTPFGRHAGATNALVPADGVYYCSEVSSPYTTWECMGQVTPELARRRSRIVRITVRDGRRLSDETINGHGAPVFGLHSTFLYGHDAAGRVVSERVLDGLGVERMRYVHAPDGSRDERLGVWGGPARFGEEDDTFVVVHNERDARGRRTRARYEDASGAPRTSTADATEARFSGHGESFWPTVTARFDRHGRPTDEAGGVHRLVNRLTPWGYSEIRFFAADGSPATSRGRWGWDRHFDAIGNIIRVENVDSKGNLVATTDGIAPRAVFVLDEHGDRIEERRFSADGSPTNGPGAALVRRVFDEHGREKVAVFLDAAGRPSVHTNYARAEYTQDAVGALIERKTFRADGRPGHHTLGDKLASTKCAYDERHSRIEERNFAADGSPGVDMNGVSVVLTKYHHDQIIEVENRGPTGELVAVNGVARTRYQRDATGMLLGRTYEDASGAMVKGYDYHAFFIGFAGTAEKTPATRTREEALSRASALIAAVATKASFWQAGVAFADDPNNAPMTAQAASAIRPELAAALEKTAVGGMTGIVETPVGLFVGRRLR